MPNFPPRLIVTLTVLGCLPLMFWHLAGLMERPHYQFVLVLPIGAWLLTLGDPIRIGRPRATAPLALVAYFLGLAILLAATFVWSPWLGFIGAMILALPCLYWLGGRSGLESWWRPWMLFWTALPLPFGIDQDLINRLRDTSTSMTSKTLDVIGVLHGVTTNIIKLPNKSLYVADACSGIHSLFVLLATALFLGLWNRRHLLHTVTLVGSSLGIVLVENVARLVTVAYAFRWKMDLSYGTSHTILGILLFGLSMFFLVTTDQFLRFLLPIDFLSGYFSQGKDTDRPNSAVQHWNIGIALGWGCVVIGLIALIRMPHRVPELAQILGDRFELPAFGKEVFGDQLKDWDLVNYERVQRVEGDPLGRESQIWTFKRGALIAAISVDAPYYDYHDLTLCYSQIGWHFEEKQRWDATNPEAEFPKDIRDEISEDEPPIAFGRMTSRLDGNGLLFFSQCDALDRYHANIFDVGRGDTPLRTKRRFESFWRSLDNSQSNALEEDVAVFPVVQFQLLARTQYYLTTEHRNEVALLYIKTRAILAEKCRTVMAAAK